MSFVTKSTIYPIYTLWALCFIIILSFVIITFNIKIENTNTEDTKIMHVFESNLTEKLINKLKTKPTNLLEWKQRHYLTYYLNKNQKVKIYLISGISGQWYGRMDILCLKYNHDGTLMNCDVTCIWNVTDLGSLTLEELKTADALLNVDYHILPEKKSWEGQKFVQFSIEPHINCPSCSEDIEGFDF
ncbi:hypothetical protein C2G38_2205856 [Gigaspora rosea]|uniref:Uncharacterized protein n=1 Tax=Gigaspora rosea TaxID=44941 RepID=A0A397UMR4_9GLOM|nr:hypothetical protein C2G38_2205856 [Gigaspora rosea]